MHIILIAEFQFHTICSTAAPSATLMLVLCVLTNPTLFELHMWGRLGAVMTSRHLYHINTETQAWYTFCILFVKSWTLSWWLWIAYSLQGSFMDSECPPLTFSPLTLKRSACIHFCDLTRWGISQGICSSEMCVFCSSCTCGFCTAH